MGPRWDEKAPAESRKQALSSELAREEKMKVGFYCIAFAVAALVAGLPFGGAETLDQVIAGAKKEGSMTFIAGAQTYGGRKGLAEIEAGMAKKFGVRSRIEYAAGPSMPARAAQIITELKAGQQASSDVFLGSQSHFALLHKNNALQKVAWSELFPWITKKMEAVPGESVLSHTSINGVVYNSILIPKDKAPRKYEDLVDPVLSPTWAGKMAIPPYFAWLVELSFVWGEEKVKDLAGKLVGISAGRLRYNEEERIISGEFSIMANMGGALEHMWKWQKKAAPLVGLPGSTPPVTSFFQLGVPKNAANLNMAKLFVAFMATKEGQAIEEKYEYQSSHLVEGTIIAKYVHENGIKVPEPKQGLVDYLKNDSKTLKLQNEIAKILKR
jgi:ABC-type Fe3+ transport system substrate-binding protein